MSNDFCLKPPLVVKNGFQACVLGVGTEHFASYMNTEAAATLGWHRFLNWLESNWKKAAQAAAVVGLVALVVSFYFWRQDQQEIAAGEALSNVTGTGGAEDYLKLAAQFSKTAAAPRAVLLAAGDLFAAGKYADAQAQFERVLHDYPESSFRVQAMLGVAASLDAQGKTADATTRYSDLIQRYPNDAVAAQAKSALARLYEAQNQPDKALQLYQDLARSEAYSSFGLEAGIRMQDLLAKHPELKAKPAPASLKQP